MLEWVAIPFSRVSSPTQGSNPSLLHCIAGGFFIVWVTREAHTHTHTYMHTHTHTHTHKYICTYIYIYIYTHTHIHIYIYTHTYIYWWIYFIVIYLFLPKYIKFSFRSDYKTHSRGLLLTLHWGVSEVKATCDGDPNPNPLTASCFWNLWDFGKVDPI